jgi:Cu2+-exporting ATPase
LNECLPRPRCTCLITPDGGEVLVPVDRLRPGDRVVVSVGETVPADGRVIGGEGLIDEQSVRGLKGATRKTIGDSVLAGSTVHFGTVRVEVKDLGDRTRASLIARALIAATSPTPGPTSPALRAEAYADRAVGPTLATAGVGLLIGDLTTVGAILPPDYATGPGLAVPLETLRDAALCTGRGIVVCRPDIFQRLAEVDLIVLDDDPALSRVELDVAGVQSLLPEPDLLRYAASAFRHLADDRATALQAACRNRRIHLLDLPPAGFGPGVTVVHGQRRVCVQESRAVAGGIGPLTVDVDGTTVGLIEFVRSSRPESASALRRIRAQAAVAVALVSSRAERDVAALGSLIGVDVSKGGFSGDATARFLGACRERGLRTAFVGHCQRQAAAAALAHVAVSFVGEADLYPDCAAAVLPQPRLDLFADLWEIARRHEGRVVGAQKLVMVPNVFCVAGAFLFGFTSLTAVVITNLATFTLYNRAIGPLRDLKPAASGRSRPSSLRH